MDNDYALHEKIALITGASAGMGLAIACRYLAAGATVIGTGRHLEKLTRIQEQLPPEDQPRFIPIVSDVGKSRDNQSLLDTITQRFGRLDVLVNNAGIMDKMTPAADVTDELWQNVMNVNLRGPFELCRGAIGLMLKAGHGNIINIASGGGIGGGRAGAAYVASKFALVGLSKNIAYMYAHEGIRCNCICPGGVATEIAASAADFHPLGTARVQAGTQSIRIGEPEEIANIALFLASERSSLVNGVALLADAGRSAW